MRREILIIISLGLLTVFSAVTMAQGGTSVYLPLVYGRVFVPIEGEWQNPDFEAGAVGWNWAYGITPIVTGEALGEDPPSGVWAAKLNDRQTSLFMTQSGVIVPPDKPILTYWRRIVSERDDCDSHTQRIMVGNDNKTVYDNWGMCYVSQTQGWQRRELDLAELAGQEIGITITGGQGPGNYFLVDDFEWTAP